MTISHPGLVAIALVVLGALVAAWIAGKVSRWLARYDAREHQVAVDLIAARVGPDEPGTDALAVIETLALEEITLIRAILETREVDGRVSADQATALRLAHRRGLAVRQRCGDPALDAELGWLQGYGSMALMTDLSELDRPAFERALDHRAAELHRALALRRSRPVSRRQASHSAGELPRAFEDAG